MMDKYHKHEMKENFSEQKRFADALLETEEKDEIQEEQTILEDVNNQEPARIVINNCRCPQTEFTTFKTDIIVKDKSNKVSFGDEVVMNKASTNTLLIDETPFARFDSLANKLIIG